MSFVDEHLSTLLIFEEGYMFIKMKYEMFVHMYTNYWRNLYFSTEWTTYFGSKDCL